MVLGQLTLWVSLFKGDDLDCLDKDNGHLISKYIARTLTREMKPDMISLYPSNVNTTSLEFIVEIIGHAGVNRGGVVDFEEIENKLVDRINKAINDDYSNINDIHPVSTDPIPARFSINGHEFHEISFCDASAQMIYCYKQDDYLIPDSDPHDVMSSENMYDSQDFSYSGRFLPMIKLWCDIIQPINTIFTGKVVDMNTPLQDLLPVKLSPVKKYEFDGLGKDLMKNELEVLNSQINIARPFNKYYKMLVSSRTMIPAYVEPIIRANYKHHQLVSKSYYVLDLVNYMFGQVHDERFFDKFEAMMKELRGSTLVVLIDVPNYFMQTQYNDEAQSEYRNRNEGRRSDEDEDRDRNNDEGAKADRRFLNQMAYYNIMDIDDSLDYASKTEVIRKIVNTYEEATKDGSEYKDNIRLVSFLFQHLRDINLFIAYTDMMAYNQDYMMDSLKGVCKEQSIEQVCLTKESLDEEAYVGIAKSTALVHYNMHDFTLTSFGKAGYKKKDIKNILDYIDSIVARRNNDPNGHYMSLYSFKYFVNYNLDYAFNDSNGDEYFSDFKTERNKRIEEKRQKLRKEHENDEDWDDEEDDDGYDDYDEDFAPTMSDIAKSSAYRSIISNSSGMNKESSSEAQTKLEDMIGLAEIKRKVNEFADFVELTKMRQELGLKVPPISKHMVFSGNPGTAKTTVARMLGKILQTRGLLPTANVKHVSREDLVGKYVGWTAQLTKKAIEDAKGGILFIDEAYSLTAGEGGTNSYGMEAINTLVNAMDKKEVRDNTIIIFAGYKKPMKEFIQSNPGLKSRIGFYFDFPDYTTDELVEIAKLQAKENDYILSKEYIEKLREAIDKERGVDDFGNGRFVRSIFEKSTLQQATRLMKNKTKARNMESKDFKTILGEDFSEDNMDDKTNEKHIGFTH